MKAGVDKLYDTIVCLRILAKRSVILDYEQFRRLSLPNEIVLN